MTASLSRSPLLLVFVLAGCALAGCSQAAAANEPPSTRFTISVVGTNDLHGHLETLAELGGYLANLRRARARDGGGVVLVDAGDMFQGTLESNLGEGAAVVRAYNLLGYDAAAIGNHEFDFGPVGPSATVRSPKDDPRGALRARAAEARFPFLAGNLLDRATGGPPAWDNVRPATIVNVAGVKVGIVGITTIATGFSTLAANFVGLAVRQPTPAITEAAAELRRRGATVVIVVAHAGGECRELGAPEDLRSCEPDSEIFQLARALPSGAVDGIVAGHTHQGIAHRVAGIPIVESFSNGRAFGRIDLVVDRASGRVVEARIFPPYELRSPENPAPESYEGAPLELDAGVKRAVAPALAAARSRRDEKLGDVVSPILRAYRSESALGNLVADLMRAARPGADVAITNGGGLRADLRSGALTYGDLYAAFPFDNTFATLPVTGAELADLLARNLRRDSGIVSVSGLRVSARCAGPALQVRLTRPDGRPVRPGERLNLVTTNFLATGGDGLMPELAGRAALDPGEPVREAMAKLLRQRRAPLDGRDPAVYDPLHPRLTYPAPRPVRCGAGPARSPNPRPGGVLPL